MIEVKILLQRFVVLYNQIKKYAILSVTSLLTVNYALGSHASLFISCLLGWVFLIRPIGTLLCSLQLPNQGRWWNQCCGRILTGIWNEHQHMGSMWVLDCVCFCMWVWKAGEVRPSAGQQHSLLGLDWITFGKRWGGRVLIEGRRVYIKVQSPKAILLNLFFFKPNQSIYLLKRKLSLKDQS